MEKADIVVGIASYNNARTIGHVLKAVDAGLAKYFPDKRAVIINSDGGSKDGTTELVRTIAFDHRAIFLDCPERPVPRMSIPYFGIPGKGSALRTIFLKAVSLNAAACCVVDADLRSITPEWIELLVSPVLKGGYDFVAPLYGRHKYDGTITNSMVYPMTRAVYGRKVRQPIGGDFGFSGDMAEFYLMQDVWSTHIARFGVDIWMTTEALANGFRVCQTFLGAKIHDPKDPGADLAEMLLQVIATMFGLAEKHYDKWKEIRGSSEIPTLGFRYHAGLEPLRVDVKRMLDVFRAGLKDSAGVWAGVTGQADFRDLERLGRLSDDRFSFPEDLWARVIYDYAVAFCGRKIPCELLIRSLAPLYLAKTASFVMQAEQMDHEGAEGEVERLCVRFEEAKERLVANWHR